MRERKIEDDFRQWCEQQGFPCLKLKLENEKGFPDRTVILPNGKVAFIEFKKPGGRVSIHQRKWISRLQSLGLAATVCYSAASAIHYVQRIRW